MTAPTPPSPERLGRVAVGLAGLLVTAIYLLRLDRAAGLIVDDAWYVQLAQSMAQGHGYGLVNAPVPGLLPRYPPGFAALLSIVFTLQPSFPANVLWLKMLSVVSMLAVGVMSYHYASARDIPRTAALTLAVAVVITPAFVFLATSTVMSECVFTLTQLAAIVVLARSVRTDSGNREAFFAGALAAAAVLIRTAGIPIPIGGFLYLLMRRRWSQAAVFLGAVVLCVGPWLLYSQARTTQAQREAYGGEHAATYGHEFWMRWAGAPTIGTITWQELPARVMDGLVDVFGRDVAGIVTPTLFRRAFESGEEVIAVGGGLFPASMGSATGTMVVSYLLSALACLGFATTLRRHKGTAAEVVVPLTVALIVVWPQWAYRFVLPLTPFLYFYLVSGIRALSSAMPVARVALLCVVGLNLADHGLYITLSRSASLDWAGDAEEVDALFAWMTAHATEPGHVATTNPALVYLRTGRRTVTIDDPTANWTRWKQIGVRYLVCLRPGQLPIGPAPYTVLYRSARQGLWIISI